MTDQKGPNSASEKDTAEGDRREPHGGGEREGGITNRDMDEERANQESVPARGDRKGNTHA
jgi:hypothetical protein